MRLIRKGAQSFWLGRERAAAAVLILHGLTGSPAEMRPLAEFLYQQGMSVLVPRLPGHGTEAEDLRRTGLRQVLAAVEDSWQLIGATGTTRLVVGQSLGGLLALWLAAAECPSGLAVVNTPIFLYDRRIRYLSVLRLFRSWQRKKPPRDYGEEMSRYVNAYDRIPLASVAWMLKLRDEVCRLLPAINCPTAIFQSRHEKTVRPESAEYIAAHISSRHKPVIWLDRSGHLATLDCDHELLYRHLAGQLRQMSGLADPGPVSDLYAGLKSRRNCQ
ncbi:MAG: alpha/beta fold hydrolase [Negativicutes bacterium]|nr:alpha/beta fold hydrolase [Negativicutes bacterium]